MQDLICPFSATLVKDDFGCKRASRIIRRGGNEIACNHAAAQLRCTALFQRLKDTALPAFGVEDDLLQVPHGVLVKIQFGGLLGLQRISQPASLEAEGVRDIDALLGTLVENCGPIEDVPLGSVRDDITGYKLMRRRRQR